MDSFIKRVELQHLVHNFGFTGIVTVTQGVHKMVMHSSKSFVLTRIVSSIAKQVAHRLLIISDWLCPWVISSKLWSWLLSRPNLRRVLARVKMHFHQKAMREADLLTPRILMRNQNLEWIRSLPLEMLRTLSIRSGGRVQTLKKRQSLWIRRSKGRYPFQSICDHYHS